MSRCDWKRLKEGHPTHSTCPLHSDPHRRTNLDPIFPRDEEPIHLQRFMEGKERKAPAGKEGREVEEGKKGRRGK